MKVLLFISLTLFCLPAFSQDEKLLDIMPMKDGSVVYTEVVQAEGISASELIKRARRWTATNYKSANDVIQLADDNTLLIKGLFTTPYPNGLGMTVPAHLNHTLTVEAKDGRYRYTLNSLVATVFYGNGKQETPIEGLYKKAFQRKFATKYTEQNHEKILATIESLKLALKSGASDF